MSTTREQAKYEFLKGITRQDELVNWIERAIIAENALKEIDELLTGSLPITKLVKEVIRKATHSHGEG